jgi:hypothetical protein
MQAMRPLHFALIPWSWKSWLLGLLLFGGLASSTRAQTSSIQGQVVDATTQESLPGVNVFIAGTT